jgi:hypothetical protein
MKNGKKPEDMPVPTKKDREAIELKSMRDSIFAKREFIDAESTTRNVNTNVVTNPFDSAPREHDYVNDVYVDALVKQREDKELAETDYDKMRPPVCCDPKVYFAE